MKDPTERAAVLGTAASAALGEGCAIADPLVNALTVARTCPLPPLPSTFHFRLEEGELVRLGAVDYLILNTMVRSLIAATAFDESAQLLILAFTFSAEINRDDFQTRGAPLPPIEMSTPGSRKRGAAPGVGPWIALS